MSLPGSVPASSPGTGRAGNEARLTKTPTMVSMFRMSAVMWNAHRIHYDRAYATEVEGHAGVLVPANLLSSYVCELVMGWGGPLSRVVRLTFQTRAPVYDGAVLSVWGREVSREPGEQFDVVDLEVGIDDEAGARPVVGTARVRIPARLTP